MIELLTNAEMGEADRLAIAGGVPGIDLMERAGAAVADCVMLRQPTGSRIAVVAGSGNNGGDGFVAARLLAERGYAVRGAAASAARDLRGDAAIAAQRWSGATAAAQRPSDWPAPMPSSMRCSAPGLDRPVEGAARAIIEAMNARACPVYAVDLPSGINGTTGAVMGAAVKATETVTFFRQKPGHLLLPGRLHCGRISRRRHRNSGERARPNPADDIPQCARALGSSIFRVPRLDGHKYTRGHAVVLSGGIDFDRCGAACGARRAAGRRRPGDDRVAARRARGQRGGEPRGDGARGR